MKSVPRYTCFMTELSRRSSRWDRPNVLPNSYQSNQPVLEYFLTYFIRFISDQNQTFIHTWPSLSHRTLPKKKNSESNLAGCVLLEGRIHTSTCVIHSLTSLHFDHLMNLCSNQVTSFAKRSLNDCFLTFPHTFTSSETFLYNHHQQKTKKTLLRRPARSITKGQRSLHKSDITYHLLIQSWHRLTNDTITAKRKKNVQYTYVIEIQKN